MSLKHTLDDLLIEVFNRDVIELKGESEIANKC